MQIEFEEDFRSLFRPSEERMSQLEEIFSYPVSGKVRVLRVGSKVDARGSFRARVRGTCDRCMGPVEQDLTGDWSIFLMPQSQFSKHDKPGGKVIHGPTRDLKASRHHSRSKAAVLTDAEGEHEDVSFGAFDGQTVDLRPIIREELILELPMRFLCSEACKGLCLECGHNLNLGPCGTSCGSRPVEIEDRLKDFSTQSPLARALAQKFQK